MSKMVPVKQSYSIVPERDYHKSPILEAHHLGIDFGGLTAVDDFNIAIGRTEICGLIGPNGASQQTDGKFNRHGKVEDMSPEQRAKFNAARQRRFEIMVLIGAYKIMPEAERKALRSELLKRIDADFQATVNEQKDRIVRAENDLKKLRSELAERESHRSELVERELERLLKMPMPGGRGRTGSRLPEKNTK